MQLAIADKKIIEDPPTGVVSARSERSLVALERAFELARSQLETEDRLPRHDDRSPAALRDELGIALGADGLSLDDLTAKLGRLLAQTPSSASPRFFNQLFGGRDEVATLAEMLTPLLNTSMYTYKVAGPQVLVEEEVLCRMAECVGFSSGEGLLSAGASLANLTAMMIARNRAVEGVRDRGFGDIKRERLTVYTSADGHYSIRKAAGVLGLGREAVREIPTDAQGRMDVGALERAIQEDRAAGHRPLMINATAGTTVLGAFDPVRDIAGVARSEGLWLNIDGALGGSVLLSRKHRGLLDGVEHADSFVWNAHKMMGVPLSCSALLLSRKGLLSASLGEAADYLFAADDEGLDPGTRSLQCGRRNDALKLWAAWQFHGDLGYERRIDHLFDLARFAAASIEADPELELTMSPSSINVCFEVRGKATDEICEQLRSQGRLLIGAGQIRGRRALRLVCVNPDLEYRDIEAVLAEIKQAADSIPERAEPTS